MSSASISSAVAITSSELRYAPDRMGRVDHALLLGLEFDGHVRYASTPMVQQRRYFEPAVAAVELRRA
jgi:hypothetical protein